MTNEQYEAAAQRLDVWFDTLREAGMTNLADDLERVANVYGNPRRKVQDMEAYAKALHQEGTHGLAKEIEKILAEPVMSTDAMMALAASGLAWAGDDEDLGSIYVRDLANALTHAVKRIEGDQK